MAWIRDGDIDKILERMFKQIDITLTNHGFESYSYAYNITMGPDGKPVIKEWETRLPDPKNPLKPKPYIPETPEPLSQVDIDLENMLVRVIVDMPGFTKESIKITGEKNKLQISAQDGTRQINKEIPINAKVDPTTAKAKYNNGILEVTITLLESQKPDSIDIQIN
jgi:HSP20 family protein